MPDNKSDDGFWDLSELVPAKKQKISRPTRDLIGVTVGVEQEQPAGEKIDRDRVPAPRKTAESKPAEEYAGTGLIRSVKLLPWQSGFSFYSRFRADAQKYHFAKSAECPPEYFFSYMPQYEQLTSRQREYYLYWRSCVRGGIYPPADSSYIFLYLYEIINLPELIPPPEGISLLCGIRNAYRNKYRYLDKYIGEWLCDYCLINRVSPPYDFSGDALSKLSLPEMFIRPKESILPFDFISSLSPYDFRKSRFYPEHAAECEKHIPAAAAKGLCALLSDENCQCMTESHVVRDSYSGAVAYVGIKYKIEITYLSLRRSRELHQYIALAEKAAENELRAAFDVKSRFSVAGLPPCALDAIASYFDGFYKDRRAKKSKPEEDAPYMKYYAPKTEGKTDISRALRIEQSAWRTVAMLEPSEPSESDSEPSPAPSAFTEKISDAADDGTTDIEKFALSLGETEKKALCAAINNVFAAFCRENRLFPDDEARRINELSSEIIGDMVIDSDYSVICEYASEISAALRL